MVKHAVLDSNVVISLSKRQITLNRLTSKYNKFSISIITYLEVLGFNFETSE